MILRMFNMVESRYVSDSIFYRIRGIMMVKPDDI